MSTDLEYVVGFFETPEQLQRWLNTMSDQGYGRDTVVFNPQGGILAIVRLESRERAASYRLRQEREAAQKTQERRNLAALDRMGIDIAPGDDDPPDYDYDPDCPACLRRQDHTAEDHYAAIMRATSESAGM